MLQSLPATVGKLLEGLFETRSGGDDTIFPAGRVFITFPIQRAEHAFAEFGAFFQHGLRGVKTGILKTWQLRHLLNICQMLHVEQHVFHRGAVRHESLPSLNNLKQFTEPQPTQARR